MAGEAGATRLTFPPLLSLPGWCRSQGPILNLGPPCTQTLCSDFINHWQHFPTSSRPRCWHSPLPHITRTAHRGDCTTPSSRVLAGQPGSTACTGSCFSDNRARPPVIGSETRAMPAPAHRRHGIKAIISCVYSPSPADGPAHCKLSRCQASESFCEAVHVFPPPTLLVRPLCSLSRRPRCPPQLA